MASKGGQMGQPISAEALDTLFRGARTYNGYLDRPVTQAQLHEIWELMKWGPTSANCLPARLIWCLSQESKDKLAECCSAANKPKVQNAPATVIIGMDTKFFDQLPELFPHADARSWFAGSEELAKATAFRNASLQAAYFIIAARALGLDTGPMSGFDNEAVDKAFFSDTPAVKSNLISTLGYGDPSTIFNRLPRPEFDRFNTIV